MDAPAAEDETMTRFASLFAGFVTVTCAMWPLMQAAAQVVG